jgi:hypothetical protein
VVLVAPVQQQQQAAVLLLQQQQQQQLTMAGLRGSGVVGTSSC